MLSQVEIKHPDNREASDDALLNEQINEINVIFFDATNEEMVFWAVSITTCDSGPPGLDADSGRRMLS